jgi:hypothetical protein
MFEQQSNLTRSEHHSFDNVWNMLGVLFIGPWLLLPFFFCESFFVLSFWVVVANALRWMVVAAALHWLFVCLCVKTLLGTF